MPTGTDRAKRDNSKSKNKVASASNSAVNPPNNGDSSYASNSDDVHDTDYSQDTHSTAANMLETSGVRYTATRRKLVELLINASRPLTIAELLESPVEIAQSSAYRNLQVMESAGVVTRVSSSDEFGRFELSHSLTSHHHHLICNQCGDVADVELSEDTEKAIHNALATIGKQHKFKVEEHKIDLIGICASCK